MKATLLITALLILTTGRQVLGQTDIEKALFGNSEDVGEIKLTPEELADFRDKALRTTKSLSNYIAVVADKQQDDMKRTKAIGLAVALFMSEENSVEVSALNTSLIRRFKIRAYLNKLKILPYYAVKIEWFDLFFASDFVLRPDGRYEAVATIYQRFDGTYKDGGKYVDITKKSIQVIIEKREDWTGDQMKQEWKVLLGDIKVLETKRE